MGIKGLRIALAAGLALLVLLAWTGARLVGSNESRGPAVTIDVGKRSAAVSPVAIGVNAGVWDTNLRRQAVVERLRGMHTALLRFPGGSTSDRYHWLTHSITHGIQDYALPGNDFDHFMTAVVRPAGAQAMITVNYGSNAAGTQGGSPAEAAAWVRYANATKGYGVRYWEIGNEVYGNGYYGGPAWETDLHAHHTPKAYAENALAFIHAMKAADPTVKVGVVLTAPGAWPDGQGPEKWSPTVLARACGAADFVSVHWYPQSPGKESDAYLLSSTDVIGPMVRKLRSLLARFCGAHGVRMPIMVTETNSVSDSPGKQSVSAVNGLFLIEDYLGWLRAGVANVSWWALHNGAVTNGNNSPSLFGNATFGDYGLLSEEAGEKGAPDTPFPTYAALRLLSRVLQPGTSFLGERLHVADVRAYALRERDGRLAVVLVNRSRKSSHRLSIVGLSDAGSGVVRTFDQTATVSKAKTVMVSSGAADYTIGPYTAAVLELGKASR